LEKQTDLLLLGSLHSKPIIQGCGGDSTTEGSQHTAGSTQDAKVAQEAEGHSHQLPLHARGLQGQVMPAQCCAGVALLERSPLDPELQSSGVSLVSLSQTCCFYRRYKCATSAFCASEAVHRKVCWLTCCVRKDRRLNTDLRFTLASKLIPVAGPTVTYGPYCRL